jgi:anthranilate phosphoribosyltransferase
MESWPDILARLIAKHDLNAEDAEWVMDQILKNEAPEISMAAFLVALRTKGESVGEVTGLASAMLRHAVRIEVPGRALDIVGTGGDGHHTVNISTMASIVAAGAGITVVKHGNRAASSKSGAADVLQALGVNLELPPERVAELATEVGITFCFAQVFHPAMRFTGPIRKALGVPTTFNILGPLANPAQPAASAIGSGSPSLTPVMAGVLASQGRDALVFFSEDELDELAGTSPANVWEVRGGTITHTVLDPVKDLGIPQIAIPDLRGGEASENAGVAWSVFNGKTGPVRDTVILNAAAGLVADGTLPGTGLGSLVERFQAAMALAAASIDDGKATDVLDRWVAASKE